MNNKNTFASWFDLQKYQALTQLTPKDWFNQITGRRLLYINLTGDSSTPAPKLKSLEKRYTELMLSPYIGEDLCEEMNQREMEPFYQMKNLHTLSLYFFSALCGNQVATDIASYDDLISILLTNLTRSQLSLTAKALTPPRDDSQKALDECINDHNNLLSELKMQSDWVNDWSENTAIGTDYMEDIALLKVDLRSTDATILEGVKSMLPKIRDKTIAKPKKRRSPQFDSWRTSKTLEYIDLIIISTYLEKPMVSHEAAYELLFPNQEREESNFHKVTRRNSRLFLTGDIYPVLSNIYRLM